LFHYNLYLQMYTSCVRGIPVFGPVGAPGVPGAGHAAHGPRPQNIKLDAPKFKKGTNAALFRNDFTAHMALCQINNPVQQGQSLRFLIDETIRQEIDTSLGNAIWNVPDDVFAYLEREHKPPNLKQIAIQNLQTACMHKGALEAYYRYFMKNCADADIAIEDPQFVGYKTMFISKLNNNCVDRFALRTHAEKLLRDAPLITLQEIYTDCCSNLLSIMGNVDFNSMYCDEQHDEHHILYNAVKNAAMVKKLQSSGLGRGDASRGRGGGRIPSGGGRNPKRDRDLMDMDGWQSAKAGRGDGGGRGRSTQRTQRYQDRQSTPPPKDKSKKPCGRCNQPGHTAPNCVARYMQKVSGDDSTKVLIDDEQSRKAKKLISNVNTPRRSPPPSQRRTPPRDTRPLESQSQRYARKGKGKIDARCVRFNPQVQFAAVQSRLEIPSDCNTSLAQTSGLPSFKEMVFGEVDQTILDRYRPSTSTGALEADEDLNNLQLHLENVDSVTDSLTSMRIKSTVQCVMDTDDVDAIMPNSNVEASSVDFDTYHDASDCMEE
jgi:hypothetical protein